MARKMKNVENEMQTPRTWNMTRNIAKGRK
jgi:hypothetical protein